MANFTDEELEDAVSQFVRQEVKTERTPLGPLDTNYTFGEVREIAASTLVFNPSAIFYLLSLAANRVNQDVEQAIEYLDDIIDGIGEVGRDTKEVTQTSLLSDAAAALLEVERTIENNNAITDQPFSRYSRSLDNFTSGSLTPNVRRATGSSFPETYEIVRPPQKAQSSIKENIAELRDLHVTVVSEAEKLTESMSEFLSANLPLLSIQTSVQKVRKDLRDLKDEFDGKTRDGAIEITRDAFLRIQAGKSVITNLTSISDPRESRMASSSSSSDRAAAAYPASEATAASLSPTISAPYLITPSTNEIKIEVNEGLEQVVTLTPDDPASVIGSIDESYDIHAASTAEMTSSGSGPYTVPASPDNSFRIYVDGIGYQTSLTSGSRTASQVAAEINAATRIDGVAGTFDDVATASDVGGSLHIEYDSVGRHSIVLGSNPTLNPALGFTDEQEASGQDANDSIRFVVDDTTVVVAALTTGSTRTAAQVAADIAGASAAIDASAETVVTVSGSITVVKVSSLSYGEGSHVLVDSSTSAQEGAVIALGFYEGQEDRSTYVTIDDLDSEISALSGVSTERDEQTVQSGTGGVAVLDGSDYKLRLPSGTISAPISTSDRLRVANGDNFGWYPITAVNLGGLFDELTVGRPFSAVTGDESQNQNWEIHRDRLIINSDTLDLTSALTVNAASANSEIGLTPGTVRGSTSGVKVRSSGKDLSFSREDVAVGDVLTLKGPTYATQHTVTAVTDDGYQIEVTPEVVNDLVSHLYQIDSGGALAYASFASALSNWFSSVLETSKYAEDILELERTLNPLLVNKNPSAALVGTATTAANNLYNVYDQLSVILEDFTTSAVPRIDAILDMLQERGMDRAHELLLLGEISEFFGLTKDASSYGGNLLEKMRAIAQNDVPQGRTLDEENVDDRLISSFEDTDANFDFSDQDDESGVTEIDDVPDLEEEEDLLNRSL